MKRLMLALAFAFSVAGSAAHAAVATDEAPEAQEARIFSFAALGDTPYSTDEEEQFIAVLAELNRANIDFAVHVGDFKSATSVCSDQLYLQRHDWFQLSHHPFIYVPGDNDWTDCWRPFGAGRDPVERLARLREIFFHDDYSLGQDKLRLVRQTGANSAPGQSYPENSRWVHERVMFVTINVPGSDNNRTRMPEEARQRNRAVHAWIKTAFAEARKQKLPGLVLMMQADPWRATGLPRPAYADLLQALATESGQFNGSVLLVHGDTHKFRVGHALVDPATRRVVPNVTRLEVFGSPVVNWVMVRVTVTDDSAEFHIAPGSIFSDPLAENH